MEVAFPPCSIFGMFLLFDDEVVVTLFPLSKEIPKPARPPPFSSRESERLPVTPEKVLFRFSVL